MNTVGLHQNKGFKQLIQSADAAGHDHVSQGIFYKHELAQEEIAEFTFHVGVCVAFLFVGQVNVQAHRGAARFKGAFVAGFHKAWSAAGDYTVAGFYQFGGQLRGFLIQRIARLGPGRTENGHTFLHFVEGVEAIHNLSYDFEHPP